MARNARSNGSARDGGSANAGTGSAPAVVSDRGDSAGDVAGIGVAGGDGGQSGSEGAAAGSEGAGIGTGDGSGTADSGRSVVGSSDSADAGAGAGAGSGSGNGSDSAVKRGRGRPRKDASDSAAVSGETHSRVRQPRAPKPVGFAALGLGGDTGNIKIKDAYTAGAKLIFNVPKYAGMGPHWSLDDDEAQDLGEAIAAFVKTLPPSQRKKWEKKLEKYWPGINLVIVAGMITVPRVMVTVELAKMARASSLPNSNAGADAHSPYGAASNADPRPTDYDLRDVVERHQSGLAEAGASVPTPGVG